MQPRSVRKQPAMIYITSFNFTPQFVVVDFLFLAFYSIFIDVEQKSELQMAINSVAPEIMSTLWCFPTALES